MQTGSSWSDPALHLTSSTHVRIQRTSTLRRVSDPVTFLPTIPTSHLDRRNRGSWWLIAAQPGPLTGTQRAAELRVAYRKLGWKALACAGSRQGSPRTVDDAVARETPASNEPIWIFQIVMLFLICISESFWHGRNWLFALIITGSRQNCLFSTVHWEGSLAAFPVLQWTFVVSLVQ